MAAKVKFCKDRDEFDLSKQAGNFKCSYPFAVGPVIMTHELRSIKHIWRSKFFLHLVELIGAYSINVSSVKRFLHLLLGFKLCQELHGAS